MDHTCAMKFDGRIRCWGDAYNNKLVPPGPPLIAAVIKGGHSS